MCLLKPTWLVILHSANVHMKHDWITKNIDDAYGIVTVTTTRRETHIHMTAVSRGTRAVVRELHHSENIIHVLSASILKPHVVNVSGQICLVGLTVSRSDKKTGGSSGSRGCSSFLSSTGTASCLAFLDFFGGAAKYWHSSLYTSQCSFRGGAVSIIGPAQAFLRLLGGITCT